jgi:hypothetical protein
MVKCYDNSIPKKEKLVVRFNAINNQLKDHKIILLSDSHERGWSERRKKQLPSNFEDSGLVKSGALSSILKNMASVEVSNFTRKDFTVLWYGSNDASSNKATLGVMNILHFVMNNVHSNIIVANVPY